MDELEKQALRDLVMSRDPEMAAAMINSSIKALRVLYYAMVMLDEARRLELPHGLDEDVAEALLESTDVAFESALEIAHKVIQQEEECRCDECRLGRLWMLQSINWQYN